MKLFIILLIATVIFGVNSDLCSREVVIQVNSFNHNLSVDFTKYDINMKLGVRENLFDVSGKLISTYVYDISLSKKISKDSYMTYFSTPLTHINGIKLSVIKKSDKETSQEKESQNTFKTFILPLSYTRLSLNQYDLSATPKARYLERAYNCDALTKPSIELKSYESSSDGIIFWKRYVDLYLMINDDFNRELIVKQEVTRKYTMTEINALNEEYNFDRFQMD